MPVIHITPRQMYTIIPIVVIILSTESIFLSKCKVLGFLEPMGTEICEIAINAAIESLALEVTAEHPENLLPYSEGKSVCSPADISVHRRVDLQDVEVSENIQEEFQNLCSSYSQVFSNDLEDFGHTDLVTMAIEIGHNPTTL